MFKIHDFIKRHKKSLAVSAVSASLMATSALSAFAAETAGGTNLDSALTSATDTLQGNVSTISNHAVDFISGAAPACLVVFGLMLVISVGLKFVRKFMK